VPLCRQRGLFSISGFLGRTWGILPPFSRQSRPTITEAVLDGASLDSQTGSQNYAGNYWFERLPTADLFIAPKSQFTYDDRATPNDAQNTTPCYGTKVFHGIQRNTPVFRALYNRGPKRVFAILFQRGSKA